MTRQQVIHDHKQGFAPFHHMTYKVTLYCKPWSYIICRPRSYIICRSHEGRKDFFEKRFLSFL